MARMELRERKPDYNVYIICVVCFGAYLLWSRYPDNISGGNGLPRFRNGGEWEERRDITFFPEGTTYNTRGEPLIPKSFRNEELEVYSAIMRYVKIITWTIIFGVWTVVAVLCYKILSM
jgi:hypothetical protein